MSRWQCAQINENTRHTLTVQWVSILCSFLGIILRLGVPKLVVFSVGICQQFPMGANLNNLSLIKHSDLVTEAARGQSVADVYSSLIASNLVRLEVEFSFGKWDIIENVTISSLVTYKE